MDPIQKALIPEVVGSDLSTEDFQEKWLKPGLPVIIRGGFPQCTARNWDLDYLKTHCGANQVHIRKNTHKEDYKVGKKYNIELMEFNKLADLIAEDSPKAQTYYLAATNLKTGFPQINNDFEVPKYVEKVHHGPYLWVSAKNHYEFCHVDSDDGMLCLITGCKEIKLYSYKEFSLLYPNPHGSLGRTVQSQVNCSNPNLILYPKFANAVCEEGTLHPGDLLFIPGFYWHQVTSTLPSISINIFWGDAGESNFIQKLIKTRWEAFSYWFENILEQNRNGKEKIIENLPGTLAAFFVQQFKEELTEEQMEILVAHALKFYGIEERPTFSTERKHPARLKIRGLLHRG